MLEGRTVLGTVTQYVCVDNCVYVCACTCVYVYARLINTAYI